MKVATEGLVALENLEEVDKNSVLIWPADVTTIPGTESSALR